MTEYPVKGETLTVSEHLEADETARRNPLRRVRQLQARVEMLTAERDALQSRITELGRQVDSQQDQIDAAQTDRDGLVTENTRLQARIDAMLAKVEEARADTGEGGVSKWLRERLDAIRDAGKEAK